MNQTNRIYSCKNEELLPISKFTLFSFKRDIADFSAFSTQFNDQYVADMEAMIAQVEILLEPQTETLALKQIYQEMEKLLVEIQKALLPVEGYLKLGKKEIGITPASFGISPLRRSINKGDSEAVLKGVKIVITNIQTHNTTLEQKGMPATALTTLQDLQNRVAENKQKQYEIKTNRASIVQSNIQTLNTLYLRMSEIYTIGKVLYKTTNPVKYDEYTFSKLIKKVRNTSSPKSDVQSPKSQVETL